jgi:AcrR family transcriptional regulator
VRTEQAAGGMAAAERLWELQRRDAGSASRGLNLEQILEAAIALADERGVADLSMATIARELGYSTMALYRHVSGKADLLEAMVDVAVGSPPADIHEPEDWRAQMTAWSMALAAAYRRHQWVFDVPISGPPVMPNSVRWMEAGLRILKQTGLAAGEQVGVLTAITSYVRGIEQLLAQYMRYGRSPRIRPVTYGEMLTRLLPKGELPVLEGLVAAGVFGGNVSEGMIEEHERDLLFGLDRLLDGIQLLIDEHRAEDRI